MAFLNQFQIFGNVMNDVALSNAADGTQVITIYINCVDKKVEGNKVVEFSSVIPVQVFGAMAVKFSLLPKGCIVGVQGHILSSFGITSGRHSVEFIADDERLSLIEGPNGELPSKVVFSPGRECVNKQKNTNSLQVAA